LERVRAVPRRCGF